MAKGGRPRIKIDLKLLADLVTIQCTAAECASVLNVSEDTIDRRLKEENEGGFADFYKKHADEGKTSLRRMQWKSANGGSVPMLIWLGKQMLNQRDRQDHGHTLEKSDALSALMEAIDGRSRAKPDAD